MCFDKWELTTEASEKIVYTPLSFTAGSYHENVISLHANPSIGYLRYLALFDESFKLWKHEFKATKDTSLIANLPGHSFLALSFTLKNEFHGHVQGLGQSDTQENQFQLTYLPVINVAFQFKAGEEYTVAGIDITRQQLNSLLPHYHDVLSEFMMIVDSDNAVKLTPRPLYVTPEMILLIRELLENFEGGKMTLPFLQSQALMLIMMAIEQVRNAKNIPRTSLTSKEMRAIHGACEYLKENLDKHVKLATAADKYNISEQKLSRGFREMAGIDLPTYILHCRMEFAKILLTTHLKSVKQTSKLTGYNSTSNFSQIFKKVMGYPPSICSKLAKKKF